MRAIDWKKYTFVFLLAAAIFATVFWVSALFNNWRVADIRSIGDQIAVDILSSETQFSLLEESSCQDLGTSVLSTEINALASKLSYAEENLGSNNLEVVGLKRYYSLLQIKDYLLMKKISEKCGTKPVVVLYFYSNAGDCPLCERTGYILTYLREQYPDLRVYSFDYHLDLSALRTLVSMFKIENKLPALIVNEKVYYNLSSLEEIEKAVPELKKLKTATSTTATTSKEN